MTKTPWMYGLSCRPMFRPQHVIHPPPYSRSSCHSAKTARAVTQSPALTKLKNSIEQTRLPARPKNPSAGIDPALISALYQLFI